MKLFSMANSLFVSLSLMFVASCKVDVKPLDEKKVNPGEESAVQQAGDQSANAEASQLADLSEYMEALLDKKSEANTDSKEYKVGKSLGSSLVGTSMTNITDKIQAYKLIKEKMDIVKGDDSKSLNYKIGFYQGALDYLKTNTSVGDSNGSDVKEVAGSSDQNVVETDKALVDMQGKLEDLLKTLDSAPDDLGYSVAYSTGTAQAKSTLSEASDKIEALKTLQGYCEETTKKSVTDSSKKGFIKGIYDVLFGNTIVADDSGSQVGNELEQLATYIDVIALGKKYKSQLSALDSSSSLYTMGHDMGKSKADQVIQINPTEASASERLGYLMQTAINSSFSDNFKHGYIDAVIAKCNSL